jgi:hypothetical protein
MVLYLTTWQEEPHNPEDTDTMITKPAWFKEYEEKQEKFNERILSLVESLVERVDNLEKRIDNLEKRIDNLVVKNNLKE